MHRVGCVVREHPPWRHHRHAVDLHPVRHAPISTLSFESVPHAALDAVAVHQIGGTRDSVLKVSGPLRTVRVRGVRRVRKRRIHPDVQRRGRQDLLSAFKGNVNVAPYQRTDRAGERRRRSTAARGRNPRNSRSILLERAAARRASDAKRCNRLVGDGRYRSEFSSYMANPTHPSFGGHGPQKTNYASALLTAIDYGLCTALKPLRVHRGAWGGDARRWRRWRWGDTVVEALALGGTVWLGVVHHHPAAVGRDLPPLYNRKRIGFRSRFRFRFRACSARRISKPNSQVAWHGQRSRSSLPKLGASEAGNSTLMGGVGKQGSVVFSLGLHRRW